MREQSQTINRYIEALNAAQPTISPERVRAQLKKAQADLAAAEAEGRWLRVMDAMERVNIHQAKLDKLERAEDIEALQESFVGMAAAYTERKGISYATWRYVGVPPKVLKEAGIGN
jgi:hypothetical protein